MSQQLLTLPIVNPLVEHWDADLQTCLASIKGALRAFVLSISTLGDTATNSSVYIQLVDANGAALHEQVFVRVRITDNNSYLHVTGSASFSPSIGSSVEVISSGVDEVLKTDTNGQILLTITNPVAETFQILLGHATLCPAFADHKRKVSLTIPAAPSSGILNASNLPVYNAANNPVFYP